MKNLLLFAFGLFLFSCSDPRNNLPKSGDFGAVNEATNPIDLNSIQLNDSSLNQVTLIRGTISKVCQGEGCWLSLNYRDSIQIRVNAKDKKFILPKGIEGKTAIAQGMFKPISETGKISFEATGIRIE